MSIKPDKKVLLYWRLTAAFIFAAVFSASVLFLYNSFWLFFNVCALSTAIFCTAVFLYMPALFKNTVVSISNDRIICKKGVLFRREYIYPNARLVYFQTVQLPIASCFGLRFIILRGAGNSLIMPPLTAAQTEALRKAVQNDE